jgi:hypothetical protein
MNEYLKKIHDDAKKYMPHGENGSMWNSGTWSNNHVMSNKEKSKWDKWLNGTLISNQSEDFNQNVFEDEILVYERKLPSKEHFSSLILYQEGEKFELEPTELNSILNQVCLETNKSQIGIWFYGHQGDTYKYAVHGFGTYTLKSLKTKSEFVDYNATLEPLFANLINPNKHQLIENNCKLISGIVGVNQDWLILLVLEVKNKIKVTIHGDKEFCKIIGIKMKASR